MGYFEFAVLAGAVEVTEIFIVSAAAVAIVRILARKKSECKCSEKS